MKGIYESNDRDEQLEKFTLKKSPQQMVLVPALVLYIELTCHWRTALIVMQYRSLYSVSERVS